jgi:hypothetical protein
MVRHIAAHGWALGRSRGSVAALFCGLTAIGLAVPAQAQQLSISGAWNGSGTVSLPSGNTEKVRCRATFSQSGANATMNATCASPSTKVTQSAALTRVSGNKFAGDFTNAEYGISGSIRVTVNGNSLSASMQGGGGSAFINLSR